MVKKGHKVTKAKKAHEKPLGFTQIDGCRCRCGHEWVPREYPERPSVCPVCKSPRWDKEKLFERAVA